MIRQKMKPTTANIQRAWGANLSLTMRAAATTLLMSLSLGISTSAVAGADYSMSYPGSCYPSGTTMLCYGTMAGIRAQTADPWRLAYFFRNSSTYGNYLSFNMIINGSYNYCYAPDTELWNKAWDSAMAANALFFVQYDIGTGTCTNLQIYAGSSFKNANAL